MNTDTPINNKPAIHVDYQIEKLENKINKLKAELAAVTEQLETARDTIAMFTNTLRNNNDASKAEYDELIEQRDMLAEALQKLADCDWVITPRDRMDAVRDIARQALQSLNQPNESNL